MGFLDLIFFSCVSFGWEQSILSEDGRYLTVLWFLQVGCGASVLRGIWGERNGTRKSIDGMGVFTGGEEGRPMLAVICPIRFPFGLPWLESVPNAHTD